MSDLVGNPEDRFSHNEAHIHVCWKSERSYRVPGRGSTFYVFVNGLVVGWKGQIGLGQMVALMVILDR